MFAGSLADNRDPGYLALVGRVAPTTSKGRWLLIRLQFQRTTKRTQYHPDLATPRSLVLRLVLRLGRPPKPSQAREAFEVSTTTESDLERNFPHIDWSNPYRLEQPRPITAEKARKSSSKATISVRDISVQVSRSNALSIVGNSQSSNGKQAAPRESRSSFMGDESPQQPKRRP